MRQKSILLAFVEAVHLVDKNDGSAALALPDLGLFYRFADVFNTAQYGTHGNKLRRKGIGHQPCNGGFAGSRWPPQNTTVRLPGFKRHPQRHTRPQQVLLANHLAQGFGAQALSQGWMGCSQGG